MPEGRQHRGAHGSSRCDTLGSLDSWGCLAIATAGRDCYMLPCIACFSCMWPGPNHADPQLTAFHHTQKMASAAQLILSTRLAACCARAVWALAVAHQPLSADSPVKHLSCTTAQDSNLTRCLLACVCCMQVAPPEVWMQAAWPQPT